MSERDDFFARCRAAGLPDDANENTWNLMVAIERILNDEDVGPWQAPETVYPKKVRLARLFLDTYGEKAKS